jgi:branched-chain amino acid transport system ATP-binding protein
MNDALLELQDVTRQFGGVHALSNVTFSIHQGEILGLIGPNGAGKTTAINVISGFLRPTEGRIVFQGTDITGFLPHQVARQGITRTFQAASVFPDVSVLENVMRGGHLMAQTSTFNGVLNGRRTRLAQARLKEFARELLDLINLADASGTLAGQLSYGYQKRLGIAIALASKPSLLLLDEPAAGLNPEEGNELGRLIEDLQQRFQIAVLMVEHHMRLVMSLCHRLVVLDQGQKISEGTPTIVQGDSAVIAAYLGVDDDYA